MDDLEVGAYVNASRLCGRRGLSVWDDRIADIGECFQTLAMVVPAHALLGMISAYPLGRARASYFIRGRCRACILLARFLSSLILCITPAVGAVILIATGAPVLIDDGWAIVLQTTSRIVSWAVHSMYVFILRTRLSPHPRGNRGVLASWIIVCVVDVIQSRTILMTHFDPHLSPSGAENNVTFVVAAIRIGCHCLYFLTLLPGEENGTRRTTYEELFVQNGERRSLLDTGASVSYGGLIERHDYLGVAKENASLLSRLFLYWVYPLIRKGRRELLKSTDDVFDVPIAMSASVAGEKFQFEKHKHLCTTRIPLLRILFKLYGKSFIVIGFLKLIADICGFFSPLLLNLVVTFIEAGEYEADIRWGYLYAIGLIAATFSSALLTTHFNLLMSELKLKIRACVMTAVYQHVVGVPSYKLTDTGGGLSLGSVVNYMSTDTDRLVNFCPSLHAVWSLPFQFVVTLCLLYGQVGVACFAGVGLCILMVPLNKKITDCIAQMSSKMMSAKDARIQQMSEVLSGIRVIKYFLWEDHFVRKVGDTRAEELKYLKRRKYLDALCVFFWATTPVLMSVCTFATYVMLGNPLSASKVFTAVALFQMLTGPINAFSWVLNGLVEAMVSIRRLSVFLSLEQMRRHPTSNSSYALGTNHNQDAPVIAISGATFTYGIGEESSGFKLSNISLKVYPGEMIGITGKVGSGKSSLLSAILGEMMHVDGDVEVHFPESGVGYVHQEPWLQHSTIRDNILYGKLMQPGWYRQVVDACALEADLMQLPYGDLTSVGEKGSMLSGGQKVRVALARAVYQDKQIYLLDDIFSAVDAPVAMHIYRMCLMGLLKNKTRLVCTHHTKFLTQADTVLRMLDGCIDQVGPPHLILSDITHFQVDASKNHSILDEDGEVVLLDHKYGAILSSTPEETRESGVVKFEVYKFYFRQVGLVLCLVILVSICLMEASKNLTDVWLAGWINAVSGKNTTTDYDTVFYLKVYVSIAASTSAFALARSFLFAFGGICAARSIHNLLFTALIKGHMSFFDSTPTGRILNRIGSDLYAVDDSLPFILNICLAQFFGVVGPVLVCSYALPWVVLVLVPLAFVLYDIQAKYRPTSRDLKRIGSVSLSPIYTHFADTVHGLITIRAMRSVTRFVRDNDEMIESNQKAQYAGIAASQWLELRLQLIGCAVVSGIAIIAVVEHHTNIVSPGLVGLAISYALGITSKLSGLVSSFTETEREMVAVERCYQYIDEVPQEDLDEGSVIDTPSDWPTEGKITFKNVNFRYREHLPLALQNFNFETKSREKLGVVGRTGSGKSSLFRALFRTAEVEQGSEILIDDINCRLLSLRQLRRSLSIIPQDPFVFTGSIRENLDPTGERGQREDAVLWDALKKSHLDEVVRKMPNGLDANLKEGGKSLSIGQRQLMCIARAVLSSAKIVCVDEATANVDKETDFLVQQVLRDSLSNCSVIAISHRVDSVLGSDRIVVMSGGKTLELGHPNVLLQDPESELSKYIAANDENISRA